MRIEGAEAVADLPRGADVVTAFLDADAFMVLPAGTGPVPPGSLVDLWEAAGMGGRTPHWVGPA